MTIAQAAALTVLAFCGGVFLMGILCGTAKGLYDGARWLWKVARR